MAEKQALHHDRTLARRQALGVLYQSEITGVPAIDIVAADSILSESADSEEFATASVEEFARMLVSGVSEKKAYLDSLIAETAENWTVERMPITDRNVLRLAIYEMVFVDDVPCGASINEAVSLAHDFGGEDDSPRFVNGVLGVIAAAIENGTLSEED